MTDAVRRRLGDTGGMSHDRPFPEPGWNDPDSVALALAELRAAHDEASAHEACDRLLFAVGDNHAGTFRPVALAVMPELKRVLVDGLSWAQRAALEALIDLGGTFVPEAGFEMHEGVDVRSALRAALCAMRPEVAPLAVGDDARARSAADLLELIDDLAA